MLGLARLLIRALELVLALPFRILRALVFALTTRPSFGPLRHALTFAFGYLVFALALVYAVAPLRGLVGQYFLADKLRYDAERWLATAVYDAGGGFVGTFDPRLASATSTTRTRPSRSAATSPTPTTSPSPCARCPSTTGSAWSTTRTATSAGC